MSADVYQDEMVRLAKAAHGAGALDRPDVAVTVDNPLCGDRVTVELKLRAGTIDALAVRVRGCLLCEAAGSLIAQVMAGTAAPAATEGRAAATALLAGESAAPRGPWVDLAVFTPVASVPSRHRCVLLPFEALCEAIAHRT